MITIDKLKQVQEYFNSLSSMREKYEDEQIKVLLRFFNIPEKKSENIMSIEELLESEVILILTPKELFENVDFKKFKFPSKIKFQPNNIDNTFKIFGFDDLMNVKIELPFLTNGNGRFLNHIKF
jgi:hypothetical protein